MHQSHVFASQLQEKLAHLLFGLNILFTFAALNLIKRRLSDINMALFDELMHLPEEKCQNQRADVAAVDVGVAHNDNFVITKLFNVEFLAYPGAKRVDNRANFFVGENFVQARFLDVQKFNLKWEKSIKKT